MSWYDRDEYTTNFHGHDMTSAYGREYGVLNGEPIRVAPDPSTATRCTLTIATCAGHELRRNSVTGELFDRAGGRLMYVGPSCGDDGGDVYAWRAWLNGMRLG
jgi:hypothetical protein